MSVTALGLAAAASGTLVPIGGWLHLLANLRRHGVRMEYSSEEQLPTPDGTAIELRRLPGPARNDQPPVLMVHGLCANHRNMDFHPDCSMARHVARAGRDVWLLTLRSGRTRRRWSENRLVTFDAMARHDVPLAVRAVLQRTGASKLDYVGFSMGGMLLYAALGRSLPQEHVRRAAIVASPGRIRTPFPVPRVARYLPFSLAPTLLLYQASNLFATLAEWVPPTPFHHWVYNPRNVLPGGAARSLVNVIVDVPGRLSADFARWATGDGQIRHPDGTLAMDGLRHVNVPVHFFAGSVDRLAAPDTVHHAFQHWGAAALSPVQKAFTLLGRATGARADYGHGDLAVGCHVAHDLFPPLTRFLCDDGPAA